MKNGDLPINPLYGADNVPWSTKGIDAAAFKENPMMSGLTKREYFAGLAMQGMIASGCTIDVDKEYPFKTRAATAVVMADALLKELENE